MRSPISLESTVVATKDNVSCDLGDEAAILSLRAGIYYGLNGVGASIWNHLKKPKKVRAVLNLLLEEYDVDSARCADDLLVLLEQLRERQLVEVSDEGHS